MRILMAPLAGAFLFLAGCAHQGQGLAPEPIVAPPAAHHTHKPPKVAKRHHTAPAVQPAPELTTPPPPPQQTEPDYRPGEQPTPDLLPPPVIPEPPHADDARQERIVRAAAFIVPVVVAIGIVGLIFFNFIRGFLAARKGKA